MRPNTPFARPLLGGAAALMVGIALLFGTSSQAADHTEPPAAINPGNNVQNAADLADLYTWHKDDGNLVVAVTFAGPVDGEPAFNRDVMYGVHIDDNADDNVNANANIRVQFAQDDDETWGVRFMGIPGASGPISGELNQNVAPSGADVKAWAGTREDPFFFDLTGFRDSVSNQALLDDNDMPFFDNTRQAPFGGKNIGAFVVEFPVSDVSGDVLNIWASASLYDRGGP